MAFPRLHHDISAADINFNILLDLVDLAFLDRSQTNAAMFFNVWYFASLSFLAYLPSSRNCRVGMLRRPLDASLRPQQGSPLNGTPKLPQSYEPLADFMAVLYDNRLVDCAIGTPHTNPILFLT